MMDRLDTIPPEQLLARGFAHMDRRAFLRLAAMAAAGAIASARGFAADPPASVAPGAPELARFPEKTDLILLTDRPPQLEMPLRYFRQELTPNEAFFVRWHLSGIPTSIDVGTFRLAVGGHVENPLTLTLDQLRKDFEQVSVVAVNQCSGNSRSFFEPRVPGGQWANGAMGNAKWTGVRLRDLLEKAKMKSGAVDVTFQGLDRAPLPATPAFIKSLPADRAGELDAIVAYEMNGAPLPMLNGFPLRLIVPGWFATYWVKALNEINVTSEKFPGFWMAKAYRVPANPEMAESPKELAKDTVPISTMPIRSLFARPEPGEQVPAGKAYDIEGLAFDSGKGIQKIEVSTDGGKTWADATLGKDLGKYSWRLWKFTWTPGAKGPTTLMARATNAAGETQPATPRWNRSGYARNVIERLEVTVG
ncbi:MAG: putative cytochrome dehydrogenase-related protein [Phycisphaerales bacterium]|nr:putative cytochrome dehydrogenase-related protein [Phycisphaerales bacterium]